MDEIETRPQPKLGLLTLTQYFKFNEKLSGLKGWKIGNDTERCFSMNPEIAKINIVDENYDTAVVVKVSSELQMKYTNAISNITLVDTFIPATEKIIDLMKDSVVAGMDMKTARFIYDHAIAMGFSKDTVRRKMKAKLGITDEV